MEILLGKQYKKFIPILYIITIIIPMGFVYYHKNDDICINKK